MAALADIVERLQALPGVETAGAVWPCKLSLSERAGRSADHVRDSRACLVRNRVRTCTSPRSWLLPCSVRIPLLAGRVFTSTDTAATTPVAVISEIVAKRYWGREDPIGHFIRLDAARTDSPWVSVIGVVGDIRNPLAPEAQPTIYRAFAQTPSSEAFIMIRTAADPMTLVSAIRRELRAVDPTSPDSSVRGLNERGLQLYIAATLHHIRIWILCRAESAARGLGRVRSDPVLGWRAHLRDWSAAGTRRLPCRCIASGVR